MKFGVLGTGTIATTQRGYLNGMKKMGDVVLEATCDPVPDRARAIGEQYGFKTHYTDLEQMLERSDVETVVNLTPIPVHGRTCLEILDSGRHVIVEKPIATTMAEARAALDGLGPRVVVKASGLAAGKGVFLCDSRDEAEDVVWRLLDAGELGPAGRETRAPTAA